MACRPDGWHEPIAAIYPRSALPETVRRLHDEDDRSLQALALALMKRHLLRSVPLPDRELWRVENWNTPEEREG